MSAPAMAPTHSLLTTAIVTADIRLIQRRKITVRIVVLLFIVWNVSRESGDLKESKLYGENPSFAYSL